MDKGVDTKNRVETRGRLPKDPIERTRTAMRRDLARLGIFIYGVQGRFNEEFGGIVSDSLRADSRAQRRMLALVCQQAYGGYVAFPDIEPVTLIRLRHFYTSGGITRSIKNVPNDIVPKEE